MPVPVITVAQMREWEDRSWGGGRKVEAVMRQAAAAVANRLRKISQRGESILFLAGPGKNGSDTRLAAEMMYARSVDLFTIDDPGAMLSSLREALQKRPAWVVDGLFGIGLNRPLEGAWRSVVEAVNESERPVLAVDVPSGLNADNGQLMGTAIRARETVTLGAPKNGLVSDTAAEWVGRLNLAADIGLVDCPFKANLQWTLLDDFRNFPPPRKVASHKGSFGHLGILAGSAGFHGAAILAARGALRAMPGLVSVVTLEEVCLSVASQLQAAMVHVWPVGLKCDAWLIGPGLATDEAKVALREETCRLWREFSGPVVVDASALMWLPDGPVVSDGPRVITPHPGEAAAMLCTDTAAVQANRPEALRELSHRKGGCWVVLKGRHSLCGRQKGTVAINPTGNPDLAQGGSGDILAGLLSGLLVQPDLRVDPERSIKWAIWRHGRAADRLSTRRRAWTAENLAEAV